MKHQRHLPGRPREKDHLPFRRVSCKECELSQGIFSLIFLCTTIGQEEVLKGGPKQWKEKADAKQM